MISIRKSKILLKKTLYSRNIVNIKSNLIENFPEVGKKAELIHSFCQEDVKKFADICGDNNPLHIDEKFASNTIFKVTIVHGILVSSLFSTLFGRCIAGSIYIKQDLNFKRPVHVGAKVIASIEILEVSKKSKGYFLTCSSICKLENSEIAVEGTAKVLVPLEVADKLIK